MNTKHRIPLLRVKKKLSYRALLERVRRKMRKALKAEAKVEAQEEGMEEALILKKTLMKRKMMMMKITLEKNLRLDASIVNILGIPQMTVNSQRRKSPRNTKKR